MNYGPVTPLRPPNILLSPQWNPPDFNKIYSWVILAVRQTGIFTVPATKDRSRI